MTSDQLLVIIPPGVLATSADGRVVPALIADLGDEAVWRYVGFFTANIRNPHTRWGLCTRMQPVLRVVRGSRSDAGDDPAA